MRNRRDSGVEPLFATPPLAVEEMINVCRYGSSATEIVQVGLETADALEQVGANSIRRPNDSGAEHGVKFFL